MIQNLAVGQRGMTSNAFLVAGDRPVLVDVGSGFDVVAKTREYVDDVDAVVLTHTHPDHVGNLPAVVDAFDVPVYGFDPDQSGVTDEIEDGAVLTLGNHEYEAIHTPGHKDDHVCLYSGDAGVLFAGDLLFANGGFGRTDLPEGNRDVLIDSIERLLETIADDLQAMYCGHGPAVTTNPVYDVELALQAARSTF